MLAGLAAPASVVEAALAALAEADGGALAPDVDALFAGIALTPACLSLDPGCFVATELGLTGAVSELSGAIDPATGGAFDPPLMAASPTTC